MADKRAAGRSAAREKRPVSSTTGAVVVVRWPAAGWIDRRAGSQPVHFYLRCGAAASGVAGRSDSRSEQRGAWTDTGVGAAARPAINDRRGPMVYRGVGADRAGD